VTIAIVPIGTLAPVQAPAPDAAAGTRLAAMHERIGELTRRIEGAEASVMQARFERGDLLVAITRDYGDETLASVCDAHEIDYGAARQEISTASRVPLANRRAGFAWSVYRDVIASLDAPTQARTLDACEAMGRRSASAAREVANIAAGHPEQVADPLELDLRNFMAAEASRVFGDRLNRSTVAEIARWAYDTVRLWEDAQARVADVMHGAGGEGHGD